MQIIPPSSLVTVFLPVRSTNVSINAYKQLLGTDATFQIFLFRSQIKILLHIEKGYSLMQR